MSNRPRSLLFFFILGCLWSGARAVAEPFPALYNTETGDPMPAEEALQALKLPPGFSATMFASEPEVQNPIGMAWDARGRLWVAENYTYAERPKRFDLTLHDRVLIFEEGPDGRARSRKVFTDNVQMLTSVEVGRGGVWLLCPPQLLFIPDQNGDDIPDGPPQVVLDGFTVAKDNYHNFANGLRWGPDGWLYGRCGASCPGEIGLPGTPASERLPLRGGIWRYHPEKKRVEVICHGTTNPWGHDWDQWGELFFVNTVNGHLWHALPGAHFVRPHTRDPNPDAYPQIDMHADHWHFDTGKGWQASRDGAANDLGGGHAHCGTMIYQGEQWPEEFRNKLFTLNFHGRRANVERLDREGSGYMGRHEPDQFFFGDPWFRAIDIGQGPDGSAFVLDWSDSGECHDSTGVHRTSGRIYKIRYGQPEARPPQSIAEMDEQQLVAALADANGWRSRMAQRRLADMAASGAKLERARPALSALYSSAPAVRAAGQATPELVHLRAMWALNAISGAPHQWLRERLEEPEEHTRAWALRLLTQDSPLDPVVGSGPAKSPLTDELLAKFEEMARSDPSSLVRSTLASTLQRLPLNCRLGIAQNLMSHPEDAQDHDLPALVWYALIPLAEYDAHALLTSLQHSAWPNVIRWGARRIAVASEKEPGLLDSLVQTRRGNFNLSGGFAGVPEVQAQVAAFQQRDVDFRKSVVLGLAEGFQGWRKAPKPKGWDDLEKLVIADLAAHPSAAKSAGGNLLGVLQSLGTLFGDGRALDEVKRVALDDKAEIGVRAAALKTLIDSRPPELRQICEKLLETKTLNATAARGLAQFDDPALGSLLTRALPKFASEDRSAVIETLVSRLPWANALLEQVEKGHVARGEVSAFHARQMRALGDATLNARLAAVWGDLHDTSADKLATIAKLKAQLLAVPPGTAHPAEGRRLFSQTCAVCHTLYGEGAKIGPDLTGANRDNLDYLLENIVDPSAVVNADFRMTLLTLKDGRILTGMIAGTTDRTLTLRTMTESSTLERSDITKSETLTASMMPEGLLQALSVEQVRDLFAYLMSRAQVPLPGS